MIATDPAHVEVRPRIPWLAAILSLLVPGLGQLYGGQLKRGVAFYLSFLAFILLSGVCIASDGLSVFLFVLFEIWVAWDAVGVAQRNREYALRPYNGWYIYAYVYVLHALLVPGIIFLSTVKSFEILSGSMEPTLLVQDHVFADVTYFSSTNPARGDIVVHNSPDDQQLKISRVLGLEGEEIEIRDKKIYLDGRRLKDPWAIHTDPNLYPRGGPSREGGLRDNFERVKIPAGTCFVLGDNRDWSYDSRFVGPVPLSALYGRLLYVYWADDKSRIGKSLR